MDQQGSNSEKLSCNWEQVCRNDLYWSSFYQYIFKTKYNILGNFMISLLSQTP